jgi:non-ribosomal peptide synthetase component F
MFVTWQAGAALYILSANLAMNAVKLARTEKLTIWNSVPSLVGMLQQLKALQPGCLPDLRLSVFGGEALPHSTASQWQAVAPNSAIFNLYGPTEATVFCLAQAFSPTHPSRLAVALFLLAHPSVVVRQGWWIRMAKWCQMA